MDKALTGLPPSEKALYAIAEMFDYSVSRYKNIYLLNKKYSHFDDLPCVTFEEMKQFAQDCRSITDGFSPKVSDLSATTHIHRLVGSLSEQDRRQITSNGLLLSQLPASASGHFSLLINETYIGSLRYPCKSFLSVFHNMNSVSILSTDGQERLLLESLSSEGQALKLPLSKASLGFSMSQQSDVDVFTSWKSSSLHDVVKDINSSAPDVRVTLDAVLREKPLSIFGMTYSSSTTIAYGVGQLYDLYVYRRADGVRIGRRKFSIPRTVTQVRGSLSTIMPSPLRRATRNNFGSYAQKLLATSLPTMMKRGNNKLQFGELPTKLQTALGLFFAADLVREVRDVMHRTPPYITDQPVLLRCVEGEALSFSISVIRNGAWRTVANYRSSRGIPRR